MNKNKFVKIGGILIVLLALAALVGSTLTFAQDEDPDTVTVPEDGSEADATSGFGRFGDRGPRGGHHGGLIDREAARELLAEELGVTVEDLDAAHDAVMEAVQTEDGRPDRDEVKALLAEQLGVTVEELKAAEDAVQEAMLAQLVADGTITQEQLDEMLAMQELRELGVGRAVGDPQAQFVAASAGNPDQHAVAERQDLVERGAVGAGRGVAVDRAGRNAPAL